MDRRLKVLAIDRHRLKTDGEGVTTLVALAGCPMRCKYCINKTLLQRDLGKNFTKEELLSVLLQDYCYFVATGGGITFGGGEPLLQAEAIGELMEILPEQVSVNIETSLCVESCKLELLLDKVTCFIIDIKTMDPDTYYSYTGRTNELLLRNLDVIVSRGLQGKCIIRIPNIPEYTDEQMVRDTQKWIRRMGFERIDMFDYKAVI